MVKAIELMTTLALVANVSVQGDHRSVCVTVDPRTNTVAWDSTAYNTRWGSYRDLGERLDWNTSFRWRVPRLAKRLARNGEGPEPRVACRG